MVLILFSFFLHTTKFCHYSLTQLRLHYSSYVSNSFSLHYFIILSGLLRCCIIPYSSVESHRINLLIRCHFAFKFLQGFNLPSTCWFLFSFGNISYLTAALCVFVLFSYFYHPIRISSLNDQFMVLL